VEYTRDEVPGSSHEVALLGNVKFPGYALPTTWRSGLLVARFGLIADPRKPGQELDCGYGTGRECVVSRHLSRRVEPELELTEIHLFADL
jgi:hypothetical protein